MEYTHENPEAATRGVLLKETSTQVFSYEYCETFKDTHFGEHRQRNASENP